MSNNSYLYWAFLAAAIMFIFIFVATLVLFLVDESDLVGFASKDILAILIVSSIGALVMGILTYTYRNNIQVSVNGVSLPQ